MANEKKKPNTPPTEICIQVFWRGKDIKIELRFESAWPVHDWPIVAQPFLIREKQWARQKRLSVWKIISIHTFGVDYKRDDCAPLIF